MSDQIAIPAVFMRGGTSKGLLFHKKDLPQDKKTLSKFLLKIMGSPDLRQIDGMGGGTSVTSKVCIISKSLKKNIDIDYFFAQVEVNRSHVDFEPTCGNMLSAVAAFSIEEGLVKPVNGNTNVSVRSVNTGSLIDILVPTPNAKVIYDGNYKIDGVLNGGAPLFLRFLKLEGVKTGKLFPTNELVTKINEVQVTCIDLSTPMVIAKASQFGISGKENSSELNKNFKLLQKIEKVRKSAALKMGMGDVKGKVLPKFCLVSKAQNDGNISSRYFTPYSCHETHAVTGTLCLSGASLIPGTIPYKLSNKNSSFEKKIIKIEHPLGVIECNVKVHQNFKKNILNKKEVIISCGIYRTCRKIMNGNVYVLKKINSM